MSQNKFRANRQMCFGWPILAFAMLSLLGILFNGATVHAGDGDELLRVKMTPQIRIDNRQDRNFAELSCQQLVNAEPQTSAEQRALAQRKQQCLAKYQQFIPIKVFK